MINPFVKYTLARMGMFVVLAYALTFVVHELLISMLISAAVTSVIALVFLRKWRDETAGTIERSVEQRRASKERLRSALAGDDGAVAVLSTDDKAK